MKNKKKAFGLIEVMTALVMMIIVIGAAGTLVRQSMATTISAQESIVAAGLVQQLIEKARFNRDKNPNGPFNINYNPNIKINNVNYERSLSIDKKEDVQLKGDIYWQVDAIVKWKSSQTSKDKEYNLSTIITKWES